MNATEMVVLLDDAGNHIGEAPKATVHTKDTPLHLAFSCYLLNEAGEVLLTRRSPEKKTWPSVWTNSFCGHPAPGEDFEDAVMRRAQFELGVDANRIELTLPHFRYRAVDPTGIVENEICPVYIARISGTPQPNPAEVADWAWISPALLADALDHTPAAFSPWLGMQFPQLMEARALPLTAGAEA
ncbi:isopentenyl-diphosphate Delta-isomerase [Paenarthrobacter ilicis]|uniref:Isopentenyl-diphosphate Delta-isomerase n=1 Tax=Paenarthrobacter ilicis TaxID=43665 RepID=A0ABX0TGI8_9MICC|nr:isopentenyl-diphosphate Delta-isomerase [Paenarthrobacter ilicis]MBM7791733.1 isopentenyl-diphosphate delta-isomerase [Paenarthrobacter ilicis]NIJ01642.1 isopentenyl-diphosphate delta-isomerase [Paenarthrobacter ilicis]